MITQRRLKYLLRYDRKTGVFIRKSGRRKGRRAGCRISIEYGYHRIMIDGEYYYAHRLAWLYVFGVWPEDQIDHINGDPSDNRIANLREATAAQNQANRRGLRGISYNSLKGKWHAYITVKGRRHSLGYHQQRRDAVSVRASAALAAWGEFANI